MNGLKIIMVILGVTLVIDRTFAWMSKMAESKQKADLACAEIQAKAAAALGKNTEEVSHG